MYIINQDGLMYINGLMYIINQEAGRKSPVRVGPRAVFWGNTSCLSTLGLGRPRRNRSLWTEWLFSPKFVCWSPDP